jgi:hypothetical protein
MVCNVHVAIGSLPRPIKGLTNGRHSYNSGDATIVFTTISTQENTKQVKTLVLSALNFSDFPRDAFADLCGSLARLKSLELSQFNSDGFQLLRAVCDGEPRVRKFRLRALSFEDSRRFGALPAGLVLLDLSRNHLGAGGFQALLVGIAEGERGRPFFFVARGVHFSDDCFRGGHADFSTCKSAILEADLSGNDLQSGSLPVIFGFLRTQTTLWHIVLEQVATDNPVLLQHELSTLMLRHRLAGINFKGNIMCIFIASLNNCGATLHHLGLANCGAENNGILAARKLLQLLKAVNEVTLDGRCDVTRKLHPIMQLWECVSQSSSIVANDFPDGDLAAAARKADDNGVAHGVPHPEYRSRRQRSCPVGPRRIRNHARNGNTTRKAARRRAQADRPRNAEDAPHAGAGRPERRR